MKTQKELKLEAGKLTSSEIDRLKVLKSDIEHLIKNPKVSEEALDSLLSTSLEVQAFCEIYTRKLISVLKQNHMV